MSSVREKFEMNVLSYPRLCALIGRAPSRLSQAMHNAGFRSRGLPFVYSALPTEDTAAALTAMRVLKFRGYSLTIPHKELAVGLVDEVSEEVRAIGALNTIVNSGERLYGFNTDWYGVEKALREAGAEGGKGQVVLFGAGGAARAALYALNRMGYQEILLCNRTDGRAEKLAEEFNVKVLPYADAASFDLSTPAVFINSSPIGSPAGTGSENYPFNLTAFRSGQIVFDMVTRETELLRAAREQSATTVSGLRMLLFQALRQFELFTEEETAPQEVMEQALMEEFSRSS